MLQVTEKEDSNEGERRDTEANLESAVRSARDYDFQLCPDF